MVLPKLRRDLVPGDRIGPYLIVARLGEGGMAEVFSCIDQRNNAPVALKRSLLNPESLRQRIEMFRREARIACNLVHDNIVSTYGLYEDADGNPILVMELLDGKPVKVLAPEIRRAEGSLVLASDILMATARALDYLHEQVDPEADTREGRGLIHRDVAPDNIFVTTKGRVKLLDFGLAKDIDDGRLTRTGILKGKAAYMSPEQASMIPLDRRTDQYSLGVTFFWLLTGACPFERENVPSTLKAVLNDPLPSITMLKPRLPAALDPVMARVLARDRTKRFPSCTAFASAVAEVAGAPGARRGARGLADIVRSAAVQLPSTTPGEVSGPGFDLGSDEAFELSDPGVQLAGTTGSPEETLIDMLRVGPHTTPNPDAVPAAPPPPGRASAKSGSVSRPSSSRSGSRPPPMPEARALPGQPHPQVSGSLFDVPMVEPAITGPPQSTHTFIAVGALGMLLLGLIVWTAVRISARISADDSATPLAATVTDAGSDAKAAPGTDAGAGTSVDGGTAAPQTTTASDTRVIALRAPMQIRWLLDGHEVASGSGKLELPKSSRKLVAHDTELGVDVMLNVADVLDYNKLPRVQLQVMARPWADVTVGDKFFGQTPIEPIEVVPGTYRVTLKHGSDTLVKFVDVGDQGATFRHRF